MEQSNVTHCAECANEFKPSGFTTGYGTNEYGVRHCYDCCGKHDRANLLQAGKGYLYLVQTKDGKHEVTNWPGTLKLPVRGMRHGRHNIAGTRIDVWFLLDGHVWHGVQIGQNTQVCRVKRTKERY